MNIFNDPSEWMDLFSEVSNHCILARLYDTFPVRSSDHYYLQCALLPISDEPDFVLEKEKIFWEKSKKNGRCCYTITGDMLLRALNVFGENSITEEDVMVQK